MDKGSQTRLVTGTMYPGEGVERLAGGQQLVEQQSRAGEETHPHHTGSCPPPEHLEEVGRGSGHLGHIHVLCVHTGMGDSSLLNKHYQ